jgi:hypothetical protein
LISIGVGVGAGAGAGGGGGGGRASTWAPADDDATAKASAKAIATALATPRPGALCFAFARESREEPRINANPKSSASSTKYARCQSAGADLPSVHRERQSVMAACEGRLPGIVVPLPQVATGNRRRRKLAKLQISCCNIRYNRI